VPAKRFDPEDMGPATLRVTGWAWYELESTLFLIGTDTADINRRPTAPDSSAAPFWRISELARTVEEGDPDPWRERIARELLAAVLADLAEDRGFS